VHLGDVVNAVVSLVVIELDAHLDVVLGKFWRTVSHACVLALGVSLDVGLLLFVVEAISPLVGGSLCGKRIL
jgi:hypothetical protein